MNLPLYVVLGAWVREEQKWQQLQIYGEGDLDEVRSQKL